MNFIFKISYFRYQYNILTLTSVKCFVKTFHSKFFINPVAQYKDSRRPKTYFVARFENKQESKRVHITINSPFKNVNKLMQQYALQNPKKMNATYLYDYFCKIWKLSKFWLAPRSTVRKNAMILTNLWNKQKKSIIK